MLDKSVLIMQCEGMVNEREQDEWPEAVAEARLCGRFGGDSPVELLRLTVEQGRGLADIAAGLRMVARAEGEVRGYQASLIEMAREEGVSWGTLADLLGVASAQAAQYRYRSLTGQAPPGIGGRRRMRDVVAELVETTGAPVHEAELAVAEVALVLGLPDDPDTPVTTSQARTLAAQAALAVYPS